MDQYTTDALKKWKEYCFRPVEIPFARAVKSLGTADELIVAKQSETRPNEWTLCYAGTSNPAIFVYAGVFAEAHPYATGNLVWGKSPIPEGLDEDRIARHASFKCAYSYAIETFHDKEIWTLQEEMDAYMDNVPGFNPRRMMRREWQNGSTYHWRYWFRVPMFLTCETRGGIRPDPPAGLHDWVAAAHKRSKMYRANPVRPEVCGLEGGRVQPISECTPNVLEYGDIVSIVFTLMYVENREDWGPIPMVTNIVRVRRANRDAYPLPSVSALPVPETPNLGLPMGTVIVDGMRGLSCSFF
ncbi:hypothetical protein OH76DRAFT_1347065 [Lentinus brumalis]|uniref:Uncharacterized protein n=1 Tax=Lentinus brumalis TaxID=2498619 RepID=A0A371DFM5_9APHY|nr:hypothetical protein OH76DRAFT_1347065 [Polyporus brumalis]